jgi:hypothetical protein
VYIAFVPEHPPAELKITVLPRDSLLLLVFRCDLKLTVRFMELQASSAICVRREDLRTLRHSLNIAAGVRATLPRVREVPVFLRENAGRHYNQIRTWSLPSTSFPIPYSLTVPPFDAIYSDSRHRPSIPTVWLYNPLLGLGCFKSFLILFTIF